MEVRVSAQKLDEDGKEAVAEDPTHAQLPIPSFVLTFISSFGSDLFVRLISAHHISLECLFHYPQSFSNTHIKAHQHISTHARLANLQSLLSLHFA